MRRVLDGLAWVFISSLVFGSFWYFSGVNAEEPVIGGLHEASTSPEHVARCRSCKYYLGQLPSGDAWLGKTVASDLSVSNH